MRLINEQTVYNVLTGYYHHTTDIQHEALREALGKVETVDAIWVVRCKDCKWFEGANEDCGTCGFFEEARSENHYCGEGERKDGDHEKAD